MKRLISLMVCTVVFSGMLADAAELRLGRYFSNGMVLQRDKANVIRGTAAAGAGVTVSFAGQEKAGKADEAGNWAVTLDPIAASATGQKLAVSSTIGSPSAPAGSAATSQKCEIGNVLVGDVILFGRQTTVDIALGRDDAGKKAAGAHKTNPTFRAIVIRNVPAMAPQADLDEKSTKGWQQVDKYQALTMSAAAYFLGRDLASKSDVPVGIVDLNMGWHFPGAWLSRETIAAVGEMGRILDRFTRMQASFEKNEPYERGLGDYKGVPSENPFCPTAGYNAVLHPLRGVGVKGVLLQLGNDYPFMYYEDLKKTGMQTDRKALNYVFQVTYDINKDGFRMEPVTIPYVPGEWRKIFGDAGLPMAFVAPPSSDLWPQAIHNQEMRELQRLVTESDPATYMILPGMEAIPFSGQLKDEALLGERSLKWVLGALYKDKDMPATGPSFERVEIDGKKAVVYFKAGTARGLKARGGALDCFEVADADAEYVPAKAVIDGETIRLSCDGIGAVFHVRYNWLEKPDEGLVNIAGLPAIPFRTEKKAHRWLARYKDDVLPEEYSTPANQWKIGPVTLINGQLQSKGYKHFSGWLGPIGVLAGPFGPNMGVRKIDKGSPADGKLLVGDVIYGANGKMLGEDEEMVMAAAIAESEGKDGKLRLGVHRDGKNLDVVVQLPVLGQYSVTSPWNCVKTDAIVKNLEKYVASRGAGSGFLFTDALFMLGAGSPEYQWLVRKNIAGLIEGGGEMGDNWSLGYLTIYLSEYYLSTGDKRVLPRIKKLCDGITAMQIREDTRRNGGWYGRGNEPRTYPAMVHAGISAMLGLTLAKECGVKVDPETYQRGLAYLERKGAPVGQIIYGDAYRSAPEVIDPEMMLAGKLDSSNGKVSEAAVLYNLIGDKRAAYINSMISTHAWYSTRDGHGGNFWNDFWTPLGAAVHNRESYVYFMKHHRWYRECHRMSDGSLLQQDSRGAGTGVALVVPRQRLRILGAVKSPFSPGAPEILKPALAAYEGRDYKQAEALARAVLADITLDKADAPTVSKFVEEAKRMQSGIASDLAAMAVLIKDGRLHEAGLMLAALTPVLPENDPGLAAIREQLKNGKARVNDQQLYESGLKAGSDEGDQVAAESADDLAKMQAKKKAEQAKAAAATVAARAWECFTPKEFLPGTKKNRKMDSMEAPADKAAKWRFTVLEHVANAPEGWMKPGFDDSSWARTTHPISWHTYHIALFRTTFTVKDKKAYDLLKFRSWIFRQQDVSIYLNGTLIGRVNNIEEKTGTIEPAFRKAALEVLKDGENTLAISTRHNWRWGMLKTRVYNEGFDFMLLGRIADKTAGADQEESQVVIEEAGE
jgi:sialate O-acetylesterase